MAEQKRLQNNQQTQSNQDNFPYKSRLEDFTRRAKIRCPVYLVMNEGMRGAQKFTSTVVVDGNTYTSSNTFSSRMEAEQDVSKVALEGITRKIISLISNKMSDKGFPSRYEFHKRGFWKTTLKEFAEKMSLRLEYETASVKGYHPGFLSSVVLDELKYTGEICKGWKEAEQSAAHEAAVSILGNLGLGTILPDIIKGKAKCFSPMYKQNHSGVRVGADPVGIDSGNDTAVKEGVTGDGDANKPENLIQNAPPKLPTHILGQLCLNTDKVAPIALDEQIEHKLHLSNCNQKQTSKIKKKRRIKKLKTKVVAAS